MNIKKYILAASALLLITACSHKTGSGSGDANMSAMEELKNKVGDRVYFDYNSSSLRSDAQATLSRQASFMQSHQNLHFIIEGHCDERGTREFNLGLGERRADAAARFLRNQGVADRAVRTVSYGKERPAATGHDESAWSENRRAVTVVE